MPDFKKNVIFLFAVFILALALAACGKRPARVDPPDDVVDDTFPLTYPDPATDPTPTYGNKAVP
jgi:predicted small lipoprotein YifL